MGMTAVLAVAISSGSIPAMAQHHNDHYYNGMRQGYGNGYSDRYDHHNDDRNRHDSGGIGPGKGALIGGAGGAAP
jgi:hypothetical protein